MTALVIFLMFIDGLLVGTVLLQIFRISFFRAYFFQKQENAGRDARKVLREQFPRIWWLM